MCFMAYVGAIAVIGLNYSPLPSDVAVVLGNDVNDDGTPSPQLKARLDAATDLYKNKQVKKIIASGGIEKYPPYSDEGVAMGKYLLENGISKDDIIEDSYGFNSMATALNTAKIMKENNFKNVVIVSQYFHLPRCVIAFKKAGVMDYSAAYPDYFSIRDVYSLIREAAAIIKYSIVY